MFITPRAAMLAGASPLCAAPERKSGDDLPSEVKQAVADLSRTFTAFQAKNDERLNQIEKKREDVVTREETDRINAAIDSGIAEVKKLIDGLEAKTNRLQLTGPGEGAAEMKAAASFGDMIGKADYRPEDLKSYRADLGNYLRRNEVKAVTMQVAVDPAGGYWVTPDVQGRMVKKIYESTPMRQLANVVSIGTDRLEGPIDNGEFDAAWVGEKNSRTQTDASQTGVWAIDVNELYAYPMVTQKLLEDARIDVEAWISDKGTGKFARKEATSFTVGTGVNQPRGLFNYPVSDADDKTRPWGTFQYMLSGGAGAFASTNPADKLLDLIFEVKAGYRQNSSFLMARRTMAAIRKLKDGQGNYLVGLRMADGALVESIFGFNASTGEDVPALGAGSLSLGFGDFREAYTIVDRLGTSVIRDNITTPGFVKFLMRRRVGGGAVNFEAVKFLKFAAS